MVVLAIENSRTDRCSHEEDKKERGYVKQSIAGKKRKTFRWKNSKLEAEWEVWEFIHHF